MGVVADVQAYLVAQGIVDGATAWPSVRRRQYDDAGDHLVTLTEDGGPVPDLSAASGIGDLASADPAIHIRVRAGAWDGDASYAQARTIMGALHGLNGTTMNGTLYQRVVALTSEPVFAGFDDQNRPAHTIAFRLATPIAAPS